VDFGDSALGGHSDPGSDLAGLGVVSALSGELDCWGAVVFAPSFD